MFTGPSPKIIGASIRAANRTYGITPSQPPGPVETVLEVVNPYTGLIRTVEGNLYRNGNFSILKFA